ncbi:MAG: hypothetical protein U1D69_01565, partial [Polynucleobacter sp.]|nr:hypothetical protein [Polynucleobacter sp.]
SIVARLVVVAERIPSKRLSWTAIGLLAALFGYYYVSRGYFPQFAKSLLFVLLPFFYLSRDLHRKNSK